MSEEEKWIEEVDELVTKFHYKSHHGVGAFKTGYLQACKVREEEIERLKEELSSCQGKLDRARGAERSWIEQRIVDPFTLD